MSRKTMYSVRVAAIIALLLAAASASAQRVALKTNALYWATTTPNLSAEARLSEKWTLDLTAGYNPFTFSNNRKLRHVLVQPEARYWFCSVFAGHFVGLNLMYSHYNVGNLDLPFGIFPELKDHRFQGDIGAVGLSYGYSWMLGRRWSLEAEVGVGVGITRYDKYTCEVCGTKIATETKTLFLPTKLGLSLVYYLW